MRSFRWGIVLLLVGGLFVLSGCQMPFKMLSRAEFENLRGLDELNKKQSAYISSLLREKEALENERDAFKAQLKDKADILALQEEMLRELKAGVGEMPSMPGLEGEGVTAIRHPEGVGIRILGDILFSPGQASLKPEGEKVLKEVVGVLADKPNKIRICGYTDSDPIKVSGWDSNFQLSGARALSVLDYLKKQGIPASRMHFAGFGEHALIPDETTGKEDKKRSRRAEIILLYESVGTVAAPVGAEAGGMVPK